MILMKGDCLELMKNIPDKSVDLILCDLPYGAQIGSKWDKQIPFEPLWAEYKRIIKENGRAGRKDGKRIYFGKNGGEQNGERFFRVIFKNRPACP